MASEEARTGQEIGSALTAFVARAAGLEQASVEVEYEAGTAFVRGSVSKTHQARAIEDLIRWHDQVDSVVSDLRVLPSPTEFQRLKR